MRRMMLRLCCCLLICHAAWAGELSSRLDAVLAESAPARSLALARIQSLDEGLIDPASLQPAWSRYSLRALRQLAAHERGCEGEVSSVPALWRDFERRRCVDGRLPDDWLRRHPVHPLGGSSAAHWRQGRPKAEATDWLHVRERNDELGLLGALSDDNLDALLAGAHWLWQDGALWRLRDGYWRVYPAAAWRERAEAVGVRVSADAGACVERLDGLCLNPAPASAWSWRALWAGLAGLALAGGGWLAWQRRRLERERRFALQMLTHELRTPIAGLAGVVEGLRRDFDRLPDSAQDHFGHLAGGVSRLRQLAEASRHYLSADRLDERRQAVRLAEWLDAIAERHQAAFCLNEDATLLLPAYWLGLCLDNLLVNARRHGRPPWRLLANWDGRSLTLTVCDGGRLADYRLRRLTRRGSGGEGMGLGLAIVRRVLTRLGGRLRLSGPPTRFSLQLPAKRAPQQDSPL
ncbi:sensor histidine kinase [Chromobacterium haemolyticum]|nr:sensor histidine kinase [Chromobacterium haemolyticum]